MLVLFLDPEVQVLRDEEILARVKSCITCTRDLDVVGANNFSQGARVIMKEAAVEVVEVVGRELAEILELLLLHRLEDVLLVVRGQEALRCFASRAFERIRLANRKHKVEVCANIEASHCLKTFRVLDSHLKVDLWYLEALVDVGDRVVLLVGDLCGRRLYIEDGAFLKAQFCYRLWLLRLA